jgi:GR25 family glycosyltransferase involved in LPS biosynthesis
MSADINDVKIYITHYSKLHNRKEFLKAVFAREGITNYTFFEEYDREFITDELDEITYAFDADEIRNRISSFIPQNVVEQFISDRFNMAEKSLGLKHKFIYKDFLEDHNERYLLVFEDDVKFVDHFAQKLNFVLGRLPADVNILLLGGGAAVRDVDLSRVLFGDQVTRVGLLADKNHPFGNGSDAYLIERGSVQTLYEHLCRTKMVVPIDWELSYFSKLYGMNTVICYPYLTYQGSATGEYSSSVRDRGLRYDAAPSGPPTGAGGEGPGGSR